VASDLYKNYDQEKTQGKNPEIPLAGVILHAAVYSGTLFWGLLNRFLLYMRMLDSTQRPI
jgi:hypothetical protein